MKGDRQGWDGDEIEYFIDAGRSAKDQKRPQLQRLRSAIEAGTINTVVVVKLDRITRSVIDFADLLDFFREHDVDFNSVREAMDTSQAMGRAMLAIIMVFAQLERETTAERTRAIMEDRVERGLWNGGKTYGYVTDADGRLAVEPEWAEIIHTEFFDAVERLGSAGAVQRSLREKGIKSPTYVSRSGASKGGRWFAKQQVLGVLRNPIYLGHVRWGELSRENCHPPIISVEQFERVQQLLQRTSVSRSNAKRSRGRGYSLRGLVRCRCGAMMTPKGAHGKRAKFHYYTCTSQTHRGVKECNAPSIPAELLEEAVTARVMEIGTEEKARERIVEKALEMIDSTAQSAARETVTLRNQLTVVKAEIGRLVSVLRSMGTAALESIQDELGRLEGERKDFERRIAELENQATPVDQLTAMAKKFIENWSGLGELLAAADGDQRREILQHFVEVIEVHPTDEQGRAGIYKLRLFPEAAAQPAKNRRIMPPASQSENGDPVLTESPCVRELDEKAPPVGLEPTTKRLTVACSTN